MESIKIEFGVEDVNLILEALGQMPFVRVYKLINQVQEQARQQMQANSTPEQAA